MHDESSRSLTRRLLLGGLAGVPVLLGMPRIGHGQATTGPTTVAAADAEAAAVKVDQVLNVADFEALAQAKLPPAHFGYVATGVDDDRTVILES